MRYGEILLQLLTDRYGANSPIFGAEVGVWKGENAQLLLENLPALTLYLVDSWKPMEPGSDHYKTGDAWLMGKSQEEFDAIRREALAATAFAGDRAVLLHRDLGDAAAGVGDQSLDFVFLDADHSYSGTKRAIDRWMPKVRPGGLVAGHDYATPYFPGVAEAVDEVIKAHGATLSDDHDEVWWFDRPQSVNMVAMTRRVRRAVRYVG